MKLTVSKGDLFELPKNEYVFAHCIATDLHWGAGIAPVMMKEFNAGGRWRNRADHYTIGDIGIDNSSKGIMVNLFTKGRTSGKPTYDSVRHCLENLKNFMTTKRLTKLAMPKIGCGLDRLNWNEVESIINDVFKDTDIEITVKYV